jgi:adenine phosphoribosyltransferase
MVPVFISMSDIIKQSIPNIPNWPIEGVVYRDITGLTTNVEGFQESIRLLTEHLRDRVDCIVAADARGFIWGGAVANALSLPLHLVRKPNKLPPPTNSYEFEYEYAKTSLHIKSNADISADSRVGVIDDVNATGGTALAVIELLKTFKVSVDNISYCCIIDLPFLGGSQRIQNLGVNFFSTTSYNE